MPPDDRDFLDDAEDFNNAMWDHIGKNSAGVMKGLWSVAQSPFDAIEGGVKLATDPAARAKAWDSVNNAVDATHKIAQATGEYGEAVLQDPAMLYRDAREGVLNSAYAVQDGAQEFVNRQVEEHFQAAASGQASKYWGGLAGDGVFGAVAMFAGGPEEEAVDAVGESLVTKSDEAISAVKPCPKIKSATPAEVPPGQSVQFNSVADSNIWADAAMHPSKLELTTPETDALVSYQTSSNAINNALRYPENNGWNAEISRTVQDMDSAVDQSQLPTSVKVFRGIRRDLVESLQPGDFDFDPGFMSTTFVEDNTKIFGDATLELTVPAGADGLYMDSLDNVHGHESELLLPRETQFQVLEREERDGRLYIKARTLQ